VEAPHQVIRKTLPALSQQLQLLLRQPLAQPVVLLRIPTTRLRNGAPWAGFWLDTTQPTGTQSAGLGF
jgi:hypothetical protein